MTLNVPEAEARAREDTKGYGRFSETACDLLALAALARKLAEGLADRYIERPETPCKWCLTIAKARAAGLLPARESAPAEPKEGR